jgi:hypothetical protein
MPPWRKNGGDVVVQRIDSTRNKTFVHEPIMVKTQQLMRFERYTIPALDDTILGFSAIFCHLRSRVNLILLTLVANLPQCRHKRCARTGATAGANTGRIGEDR